MSMPNLPDGYTFEVVATAATKRLTVMLMRDGIVRGSKVVSYSEHENWRVQIEHMAHYLWAGERDFWDGMQTAAQLSDELGISIVVT